MTNKNLKFFKVLYQSKKRGSRARLGEIVTVHGKIKTPAFVAVGTKGTVKSLLPSLLKEIGVQVAFVNTYHLVTHPGVEVIEKAGGIHQYANLNIPLMSDSGGFQVFSLAKSKNSGSKFLSSVNSSPSKSEGSSNIHFRKNFSPSFFDKKPAVIKISDDGVKFRSVFDGTVLEFTPEKSIEYQKKIGADMIMAFDECISYGVSYEYTKEATERTHRWLERCIKQNQKSKIKNQNENSKLKRNQYLYGIIQGGVFEDLRKKSAEFVVSQNTDGVAIGGVSVGESKKEMREQVAWVSPFLPEDRPVHLLGVGEFDDILDLVKYGIDTFDCVEPTRLARMGIIYKNEKIKNKNLPSESEGDNPKFKIKKIDILKGIYRNDLSKVDENCDCYVCQNFTKSYLHHLFKNRELLAYTLATYHNLFVMEKFFSWIRKMIEKDLI
jgi:tRNA-guanine transglycosylase